MRLCLSLAVLALPLAPAAAAGPDARERGMVRFEPGDQKNVPERYRLAAHSFDYEMEFKHRLPASGLSVYRIRFPSPVESPHKGNNTVHAEFYRPDGDSTLVMMSRVTSGAASRSSSAPASACTAFIEDACANILD